MDWSSTPSLGVIKKRLDWLGQRQQVLARNIANADTPGYVPRDLEPFRFRDMVRRQSTPVGMVATNPGHITGNRPAAAEFAEREQQDIVEATPSGNAVDLEQQVAKLNETAVSHKLTTQLYRKYLGLVRMAAGARD
jgi:flagellar basal-body rod protein FlgB